MNHRYLVLVLLFLACFKTLESSVWADPTNSLPPEESLRQHSIIKIDSPEQLRIEYVDEWGQDLVRVKYRNIVLRKFYVNNHAGVPRSYIEALKLAQKGQTLFLDLYPESEQDRPDQGLFSLGKMGIPRLAKDYDWERFDDHVFELENGPYSESEAPRTLSPGRLDIFTKQYPHENFSLWGRNGVAIFVDRTLYKVFYTDNDDHLSQVLALMELKKKEAMRKNQKLTLFPQVLRPHYVKGSWYAGVPLYFVEQFFDFIGGNLEIAPERVSIKAQEWSMKMIGFIPGMSSHQLKVYVDGTPLLNFEMNDELSLKRTKVILEILLEDLKIRNKLLRLYPYFAVHENSEKGVLASFLEGNPREVE